MHDWLKSKKIPPGAVRFLVWPQYATNNAALHATLVLVRVVQLLGAVGFLNQIVEVVAVADLLADTSRAVGVVTVAVPHGSSRAGWLCLSRHKQLTGLRFRERESDAVA